MSTAKAYMLYESLTDKVDIQNTSIDLRLCMNYILMLKDWELETRIKMNLQIFRLK